MLRKIDKSYEREIKNKTFCPNVFEKNIFDTWRKQLRVYRVPLRNGFPVPLLSFSKRWNVRHRLHLLLAHLASGLPDISSWRQVPEPEFRSVTRANASSLFSSFISYNKILSWLLSNVFSTNRSEKRRRRSYKQEDEDEKRERRSYTSRE